MKIAFCSIDHQNKWVWIHHDAGVDYFIYVELRTSRTYSPATVQLVWSRSTTLKVYRWTPSIVRVDLVSSLFVVICFDTWLFLLSTILPADLCELSSCCSLSCQGSQFKQSGISFERPIIYFEKREKIWICWRNRVANTTSVFQLFSTFFYSKKTFHFLISPQLYHRFTFGFLCTVMNQFSFFISPQHAHFRVSSPMWWRYLVFSSALHRSIFGFRVPSDELSFFESTPDFKKRIDQVTTYSIRQLLFLIGFNFLYLEFCLCSSSSWSSRIYPGSIFMNHER